MNHSTSIDTLHESHVPDMCPACLARAHTSRVSIQSSESITIELILVMCVRAQGMQDTCLAHATHAECQLTLSDS